VVSHGANGAYKQLLVWNRHVTEQYSGICVVPNTSISG
jgi:hypothetical protein